MNSTNNLNWYEKSGINNFPFLSYLVRESLEEVNDCSVLNRSSCLVLSSRRDLCLLTILVDRR